VAATAEGIRATGGLIWQRRIDRWFPDGALVQVVEDVPEEDDSTTYICPRIVVTDSDLQSPELLLVAPEVKSTFTRLVEVEDYGTTPSRTDLLFHTTTGTYHVTSYLSDTARAYARRQREEHPDVYADKR